MPIFDLTKYTEPYRFDLGLPPAYQPRPTQSARRLGGAVEQFVTAKRKKRKPATIEETPARQRARTPSKTPKVEVEDPIFKNPGQAIREADDMLELYGYEKPAAPKEPSDKDVEALARGPEYQGLSPGEALDAAEATLRTQFRKQQRKLDDWKRRRRYVAGTMYEEQRRLDPAKIREIMLGPADLPKDEERLPSLRRPSGTPERRKSETRDVPQPQAPSRAEPKPQRQRPRAQPQKKMVDPLTTEDRDRGRWFEQALGLEPQAVYTDEEIDKMWADHKSAIQRRGTEPPTSPLSAGDDVATSTATTLLITDEDRAEVQRLREERNERALQAWARRVWAEVDRAEDKLEKIKSWGDEVVHTRVTGQLPVERQQETYREYERRALRDLYEQTGVLEAYEQRRREAQTRKLRGGFLMDRPFGPTDPSDVVAPPGLRGEEGAVPVDAVLAEIQKIRPDMSPEEREEYRDHVAQIVRGRTEHLNQMLERQKENDAVWSQGFDFPTEEQASGMRDAFEDPMDRFWFDQALRNAHNGQYLELFQIMKRYFPDMLGADDAGR